MTVMEGFNTYHFIYAAWWYAVFLFSTVAHEAAHAWVGKYLGDDTAGRWLTLDPLPHIKRTPIGMVVMPWLSYLLMGWMLGFASVPYDPRWARRYPRKAALMSLAGPGANLLLLLLFYGLLWLFVCTAGGNISQEQMLRLSKTLEIPILLNLLYLAFNLMPVPPLDGADIPLLFLSSESAARYQEIITNPNYSFMGLFVAWFFFNDYFAAVWRPLFALLPWPGA